MEDFFANERNGHQLTDNYDPETNTLDIRSNGMYPSNVLSNLCSNGFRLDGVVCGSMEGFLQSLKHKEKDKQLQICSMKGGNARKRSVTSWQTDQIVWWKGQAYDRQGDEYQKLLRRAYQAMFDQSERFRAALMSTRGITLVHTCGETNPYRTILTADEFCRILTELRENYDKRDKHLNPERRVLVCDGRQSYEIIVHEGNNEDFSGERIHLESELFDDMNSVYDYLSVPMDTITELDSDGGRFYSIPHALIGEDLLVVETDAYGYYEDVSKANLAAFIEKYGCGLSVLSFRDTSNDRFEIILKPDPSAPQTVRPLNGMPCLSPLGAYVLATDFAGEFFIAFYKEDQNGNRTYLWNEDYIDK